MSNITMTRNFSAARRAMIDSQLRTSGVNEEYVLARMMAVPREDYLPEDKAGLAYIDRSVALGPDGYLASPLFYGKLLLEAAPSRDDRALVIEGGTGYLADLLRPLVSSVETVTAADASAGNLPNDPFTLVLFDGAIERLPQEVADCVDDGGRIVAGLVNRGVTRLASGRKIVGKVALTPVEDLGIPVLEAFNAPKTWSFS